MMKEENGIRTTIQFSLVKRCLMKNRLKLVWSIIVFSGATGLALLIMSPGVCAQSKVDPSTLKGKVLLGYQGWFSCAGDASGSSNWRSWARGTPTAESLTIDMYPDLSELEPDELYPVPDMTIGGKQAFLYSAYNRKTVVRHFQWMKEYGLDGVLVQRFVGSIRGKRDGGDVVLKNVMAGAEKYGRAFAIEYDITGGNPETFFQTLREDWQYLVDDLKVTSHPNYLHHQGKPVLSIWGMGLQEERHVPRDPQTAKADHRVVQDEGAQDHARCFTWAALLPAGGPSPTMLKLIPVGRRSTG